LIDRDQHEQEKQIMKNFRGCLLITLVVVSSPILLVVLLFVGGGAYGTSHMEQATQDLASFAQELGYKPDAHLYHEITGSTTNLVTGSAYCVAFLYYTTPMNLSEFTKRLNQLEPETKEMRLENKTFELSRVIPGLTVDIADARTITPSSQRHPVFIYTWLPNRRFKTSVSFYDTTNLNAKMEDDGRQVEGNVVKLRVEGGLFPIWMLCPATFNDTPASPFD
jgi:hypothetical protein